MARHSSMISMGGRGYTRAGILKFIDSRGVARLGEIKEQFGIDAKTAHNHIAKLSKYVIKEEYGRYRLTHLGKSLIGRHGGDEKRIYNFLLKERKVTEPKPKKRRALIEIKSYRSPYDLMASIIKMGDTITISRVVMDISIPALRASAILAFMESRGLIERLKPIRTGKVFRKPFRVTEKGLDFLKMYNAMLSFIR